MTPEKIVEYTEALAHIAASGGGPKALAAHLAKAAGGGVLLEDAHWRHLTTAGAGKIPPSARGIVESGAPGKTSRITAGARELGWLSLFGTNSAPEADLLLRLTAAAIGVELARDASIEREHKGTFWDAFLAPVLRDAVAIREEAAAHGIALAPNYLTVVLEAESSDGAREMPDFGEIRALATDAFGRGDADLGFAVRGAALFVFVPAARAIDAINAKTAATLLPKTVAGLV